MNQKVDPSAARSPAYSYQDLLDTENVDLPDSLRESTNHQRRRILGDRHGGCLMTKVLLISLVVALAGCKTTLMDDDRLRLYVMDCGELGISDVSLFNVSNDETDVRTMFVPCYLIEHEKGTLLWDAGLDPARVGLGKVVIRPGIYELYEKSVMDQVREIGYEPEEIELMALSHMHYDHCGAANYFPNVELLIQRTEHEAAFNNPEENPIFDYSLYDELADNPKRLLDGDHDVFGDGSVMIISAPGHTPGHQVLFVDLEETGPLVLSGDLYHFRISREQMRVPPFNTDKAQTLDSMRKVERLVEERGATLWIEHDMALARTLNLAPAYYE